MPELTQAEIMNNFFKTALQREELQQVKYSQLTKTVMDEKLKRMFSEFALSRREHIALLRKEMCNLQIK